MTTYSARLVHATDITRPDDYKFSPERYPDPDFVVCRNLNGSAASVYRDDAWNLTAYHPENRSSLLHFNCWGSDSVTFIQRDLIDEAKWIIFLLLFMKRGHPLSYSTLYNHLKTLKFLMRYCSENSSRLSMVLGDAHLLNALCSGEESGKLGVLGGTLRFLYDLGTDVVGYPVIGVAATKQLQAAYRDYISTIKQHAPIPTRIYSAAITTLSSALSDFEAVSDGLLEMTAHYLSHSETPCELLELIYRYGLVDYFESRGAELGVQGLSVLLSETLIAASLQVQLFTGMRSSEVRTLPYDCLTTETRDGRDHYLVRGRTTKLNHGRKKEARWVTSSRGKQAIQLAQRIAKVMFFGEPQPDDYLFVNVLLGARTSRGTQPAFLQLKNFPRLQQRLCVPITDTDLEELENIDPHRTWRSEGEYQLGAPWPLKGHQFRRSLALYAQRSGLVTLPTLKRQLQHITEEMSRYYARGSAFANDFIGNQKDHIGIEWRETQPISQYLGYAAAVIFSDGELFGGHGNWIKHRIKDGEVVVLHDREATIVRFKKGQQAFRETAIGGCVSTKECESGMLDVLDIACLEKGCKNLVGNPKKLDRAIAAQRKRVETLEVLSPKSPEYRSELSDLKVLLSVKERLVISTSGLNK